MRLKIEITGDYLTAYVSAVEEENKEEQDPVTSEDIDVLINEHKITYGISEEAINKLIGCTSATSDIIIAEGLAPTVGKSAEVRLLKRAKKLEDTPPQTNEEGDIDYISPREGWIVPIKEGEEIATKIAPTQGEPGIDILNNEVEGIWGKEYDLSDIGGANTRVDHDSLIATADGLLSSKSTQITVDESLRISDGIGPATGSIDIPLDYKVKIIISKDIKTGFSVKAYDVVVGGCIEDSTVEAYELQIMQGIVGVSDLPIKAARINVGYINGTRTIYCDSIRVKSEISSGAQIFCSQVKANIIQGSSVTASEAIWTDLMNGQNKIMIGIDYKAKQTVERCSRELNQMEEPFEQLQKAWRNSEKRMTYLKELAKKNPQHPLIVKELPQIKEIKEKYTFYITKQKELEEEKAKAIENMYPSKNPFLLVRNGFSRDESSGSIVEPDSVINFRDEIRKIMEPMGGVLFTYVKNQLVTASKFNLKELKTRLNKIYW